MERIISFERYPRIKNLGTGLGDCWTGLDSLKNCTPGILEKIEDAIRDRDFYYSEYARLEAIDKENSELEAIIEKKTAYISVIEKRLSHLANQVNDGSFTGLGITRPWCEACRLKEMKDSIRSYESKIAALEKQIEEDMKLCTQCGFRTKNTELEEKIAELESDIDILKRHAVHCENTLKEERRSRRHRHGVVVSYPDYDAKIAELNHAYEFMSVKFNLMTQDRDNWRARCQANGKVREKTIEEITEFCMGLV